MGDDLLEKLGGFTQQVRVERQPSRGWQLPHLRVMRLMCSAFTSTPIRFVQAWTPP